MLLLQKHLAKVEVLLISLSSPILLGIYIDGKLHKTITSSQKSSEVLATLFEDILNEYKVVKLFYAKGPGSFMAIKIAYIFLKTLSITQDIQLLATDGFEFNQNSPIKANGNLYFMKENGKILTKKIDSTDILRDFELPKELDYLIFEDNIEPLYVLPAV